MGLNIFNLPGLEQVTAAARAAMQAALPGTNAYIWPNNTYPAAKSFGGMIWTAYQRLDFVGRQTFALFAEGPYLDKQGAELNLPRKQATAATGNLTFTATDVATVNAGATFLRNGDNAVFSTGETWSIIAGANTIGVVGSPGAASNTEPGAPMTIGSGVTGPGAVGATVVVGSNGLTSGTDIEADGLPQSRDLSTYRGRILFRKANPAQGGSPSDYVTWGLAVAGVTRVYVERRWAGPGTVRVFPLFDDLFASAGGVPDTGYVGVVNAALQLLAPAGCTLTVAAPTPYEYSVQVANLVPNTAAVQAAIQAELADTFRRLAAVAGSDTPLPGMPYLAVPFTFPALYIQQAVANAPGVISADVPMTDQTIPAGSIPVLNNVFYT